VDGTRLWPRSRKAKPEPFLPLVGNTTLFEATVLRCSPDAGFGLPVVVTGALHRSMSRRSCPIRRPAA